MFLSTGKDNSNPQNDHPLLPEAEIRVTGQSKDFVISQLSFQIFHFRPRASEGPAAGPSGSEPCFNHTSVVLSLLAFIRFPIQWLSDSAVHFKFVGVDWTNNSKRKNQLIVIIRNNKSILNLRIAWYYHHRSYCYCCSYCLLLLPSIVVLYYTMHSYCWYCYCYYCCYHCITNNTYITCYWRSY